MSLRALPHPDGNRIDVSWEAPTRQEHAGVTVVRGDGAWPTTPAPAGPHDGVVLTVQDATGAFVDGGLRGETVYYYRAFPFQLQTDGTKKYEQGPAYMVSAMATSPGGMAEEMYMLLPAIFRRYDELDELRRFLELPGGQLDQLYSYATGMLAFHDVARVDGALLDLLAAWIGWRSDRSLPLESQRNQLRGAPALYHAIGLVPVIGATVQRVGRTPSRVKEFVHNVALTNDPPRLTLWQLTRTTGDFGLGAEPLSTDAAFGGRAAVALEEDQAPLLAYTQRESGRSRLRTKSLGQPSGTFDQAGPSIGAQAVDFSEPSLASLAGKRVLHATAYLREARRSRLAMWTRNGEWSGAPLLDLPGIGAQADCRQPVTLTDGQGYVLLFLADGVLRMNRFEAGAFQAPDSPAVPKMPAGRIDDVFALIHPSDAQQRLWVFFAQSVPLDPAKGPQPTRWRLSYLVKKTTDPRVQDWGDVKTLAADAAGEDDREPCAIVSGNRDLELCWSSHRGGRWSIWRSVIQRASGAFGPPAELPTHDGAMRAPLVFVDGNATRVVFRSSQSLRYESASISATETVDSRYSGTRTYHTREKALHDNRGSFDDEGSYLYDTSRKGRDHYAARDTVGVYVRGQPDPDKLDRAGRVLRDFIPATDRIVFVREP